jgi:hypothetical protein
LISEQQGNDHADYSRLGFNFDQKINIEDIWPPQYDMLDIVELRKELLDNAMMSEAYAFFYLFYGDNGKISNLYESVTEPKTSSYLLDAM